MPVDPNIPASSFYYEEEPKIKNVSTRERFTVIKDVNTTPGVIYEGRCRFDLDEAMQRLDQPVWQLWRSGTRTITIDSVEYTSNVNIIEGIADKKYNQIWDDRVSIFGDEGVSFTNTKSIAFDGVNDFINIPHHSDLDFSDTDSFSFSVWFKTTSLGTNRSLISKIEPNAEGGQGILFFIKTDEEISFILQNSLSPFQRVKVDTNNTFSDGAWHNVVVTYNGSTNAAGVKIYVDGALQTVTITHDTLTGSINNSYDLRIGTREQLDLFFNGNMDEVSIWNIELTPTDVNNIYNSGVLTDLNNHAEFDSLIAWYRMGDGDVFPTVNDNSATGNFSTHDGTMTNMDSGDIVEDVP